MANYLQRIAISAARTTSAARPPVSAPAVVPPAVAAGDLSLARGLQPEESFIGEPQCPKVPGVDEDPESVQRNRQSQARNEDVAPHVRALSAEPSPGRPIRELAPAAPEKVIVRSPVTPTTAALHRASASLAPALPHASAAGPVIRAPKGLRRALPISERAAMAEESTSRTITSEASISTSAPHGETPPRAASGPSAQDFGKTPEPITPMPIIRSVLTASQTHAPGQALLSISSQEPGFEPPQPAIEALPDAAPDRLDQIFLTRPVHPSALRETQPTLSVRSAPEPSVESMSDKAPGIVVRVAPAQPAGAVPGPSAGKRHSQISIGRMDLQVNNAPGVDTPSAAPARSLPQFDFLEARYLSRFSLKP